MGEKNLFIFISCFLLKHSRSCSLIYRQYCWIKYIYIYMYIYMCLYIMKPELYVISRYVPWHHVQFRSQCIQQSMNQFSNTQRYVSTSGYDELRWTSVSNKLSAISILQMSDVLLEAKCSSSLVAVFCMHSVECVEGVWGLEEFDIYRVGKD